MSEGNDVTVTQSSSEGLLKTPAGEQVGFTDSVTMETHQSATVQLSLRPVEKTHQECLCPHLVNRTLRLSVFPWFFVSLNYCTFCVQYAVTSDCTNTQANIF